MTTTTMDQSSPHERHVMYVVIAIVVALVMVGALLAFHSARATDKANQKANQLITALQAAGVTRVPSTEQVVRVLGEDGGAICADPNGALTKAAFLSMLVNGAGGPGARPVLAESRVVKGELAVIKVYCPDALAGFQDTLNHIKFANP